MKTRLILFLCSLLFIPAIILGSCSSGSPSDVNNPPTIPTTPGASTDVNPIVSTPSTKIDHLVIWIPDSLLGNNEKIITELLNKQVSKFATQNPGISVDIRVKRSEGNGNLMSTLQSANLVAPGSLPDLVLLSREEMQESALKGLLIPFDDSTDILSASDWAPVMRQLAQVQGSNFGLPVLADATVLVTKNEPNASLSIYKVDHPVLCYLNDPHALLMVSLYLSGGGTVQNDPARPGIDGKALTAALNLVNFGFVTGAFSSETMQIVSSSDVGKRYMAGTGDQMITWFGMIPESGGKNWITSVPGVDQASASLARGWFWSMVNPDPMRRKMSVLLAETLTEPDFLTEMAQAARRMPVRQSNLITQDAGLTNQMAILQSAKPEPDGLLLVTIGPALQEAVLQIQNGNQTTAEIASQVLAKFPQP